MGTFKEEEHPRDNDGKFTDKGNSSTSAPKNEAKITPKGTPDLVYNVPEMVQFYNEVKSGKQFTMEELKKHPVLKLLDMEAEKWNRKFGDTSLINTPEREKMRYKWENEFLSALPMVKENGKFVPKGKIRKEYKATIVIGLPASGKSTTIANPTSAKDGAFIFDSDEVKNLIPEFIESKGGAANAVHKESKNIVNNAFSHFIGGDREGENLVIPVIGDDYDGLMKKWVDKLENVGYDVKIAYQDTDPVQSLAQSIARAIHKGRIIPSEISTSYGDKPREVFAKFKGKKNKRGNYYVD